MDISIEDAGPFNSVRLYGQLDSKGAGEIYDMIVELGALGPGRVVVNVGAVTNATRAGCRSLIVAAKLLHTKTGEKLLIKDATPEIASILDGAGFGHLINVERGHESEIGAAA